jgi:hypothetical protein
MTLATVTYIGKGVSEASFGGLATLTPELRKTLREEMGREIVLTSDYKESSEKAEALTILSDLPYVLGFDPADNVFVAFTEPKPIKVNLVASQALLQAVKDEAEANNETVTETDGVVRIESDFFVNVYTIGLI